jgi:acetyltransferase
MADYPKERERHFTLEDRRAVYVRPIRPQDEVLYGPFLAAVTPDDVRFRFLGPVKEFSHALLTYFTHLDYARAMAFIALDAATGEMLGVVRLHATADYDSGEYAILVRSDMKGHGLGWTLMQLIIEYARSEGIRSIKGQVLVRSKPARQACRGPW